MSDVISFRLYKYYTREEKVRRELKIWYEEGYSLRYIITESLLKLGYSEPESEAYALKEMKEILGYVSQLLKHSQNGGYSTATKQNSGEVYRDFSEAFITSMKKMAKTGLHLVVEN